MPVRLQPRGGCKKGSQIIPLAVAESERALAALGRADADAVVVQALLEGALRLVPRRAATHCAAKW